MKTSLSLALIVGWPIALALLEGAGVLSYGWALALMCAWALAGAVRGIWLLAPYLPRRRPPFAPRRRRTGPSTGTSHLGRRVL